MILQNVLYIKFKNAILVDRVISKVFSVVSSCAFVNLLKGTTPPPPPPPPPPPLPICDNLFTKSWLTHTHALSFFFRISSKNEY